MNNIRSINLKQHDVRAFLDKRKTQHRIPIKPQPYIDDLMHIWQDGINYGKNLSGLPAYRNFIQCKSKHQPSDILYVNETWQRTWAHDEPEQGYVYRADGYPHDECTWRPSTTMPQSAARIWLRVKDVRVDRLQDISEDDAIAEGVEKIADYGTTGYRLYTEPDAAYSDIDAVWSFESLWDSIHGRGTWEANPWVWVYDFEQIEKPM